jgi:hypothetical protein
MCVKKVVAFCHSKAAVLGLLGFEVRIPLICGVIWGLINWLYPDAKSSIASVSVGFAAFFFIFFLQGQILRMNKNVEDREQAEAMVEALAELNQRIYVVQRNTSKGRSPEDPRIELSIEGLADFLEKASPMTAGAISPFFGSLGSSVPLRAAAIDFERALREAATRLNVPASEPAAQLANELSKRITNPRIGKRLQTLVKLNNVVTRPNAAMLLGNIGVHATIAALNQGTRSLQSINNLSV